MRQINRLLFGNFGAVECWIPASLVSLPEDRRCLCSVLANVESQRRFNRLMPHQLHQLGWHDQRGPSLAERTSQIMGAGKYRLLYLIALFVSNRFRVDLDRGGRIRGQAVDRCSRFTVNGSRVNSRGFVSP